MKQNRRPAPFNVVPGDTQGITWALPEGAIARLGKGVRAQPGGNVKLSPNGKYFAATTAIGLWWYDVSTMCPISLWETERGGINAIDFSPDGTRISIANWDGILKAIEVQNGECITQIKMEEDCVHIVCSPDSSKWVVAARHGIIQLLDIKTGQCIAKMDRGPREFHSNDVSQLEFSPNGQYIGGAAENPNPEGRQIHIWCAETGKQLMKCGGCNFAFSMDSRLLACASSDETANDANLAPNFISVYDVEKGERIAYLKAHNTWVHTVIFSPCGQFLATCDTDRTLCVWELLSKPTLKKTYADCGTPFYLPDGRLFTAVFERGIIQVKDVERSEKLPTIERQPGSIGGKWFSKCPQLAIVYALSNKQSTDKIHTFPTLREPTIFPDPIMFLPDGETLASPSDGRGIVLWNVKCQQAQETLLRNTRITSFTVLPSGNILSCYIREDLNSLWVWDAAKPDEAIAEFEEQAQLVWNTAFAPTGNRLVVGSREGKIYHWNLKRKEKLNPFIGHTEFIRSLKFSPDGRHLVSTSNDNTARVWDVSTCEEIGRLPKAEEFGVSRPMFSPCGKLIAGGIFGEVRLWCAESLKTLYAIPHPETKRCYAVAFSPCSRYLASGTWWEKGMEKMAIRLWEVASGENITTLWGHPTDIQSLAFSPDGTLLASGGFDRTIILWDIKPFVDS